MATEIIFVQEKLLRKPRAHRPRPNRIFELTKRNRWTYPVVAQRVRELATARGDDNRAKCHTITINNLATGKSNLTQEWMNILGEVFGVPPAELISAPIAENLLRVPVEYALEAGKWREQSQLPERERFEIMVPHQEAYKHLTLYAGEIRGLDNDKRYPPGALIVISKFEPGAVGRPVDIVPGKRYHVRVSRHDGMIEDSIKCLTLGPEGQMWLRPESDQPAFQEWFPLAGRPGFTVEIIGRVRGVFLRED
jgi:hypothetical protein